MTSFTFNIAAPSSKNDSWSDSHKKFCYRWTLFDHKHQLIGDSDVRTGSEMFLSSAAKSTGAVGADSPVVAGNISPLKNAPVANQVAWQSQRHFEVSSRGWR